jgi:uncharacterized membrane protein YgcG
MILQSFKDIIANKGYQIDAKDRALFETGDFQSFFGFSANDFIEFIIYDVNDNPLPQQSAQGAYVRYIPLNTQTISDYFIIRSGTIMQRNQLPSEYFIDAERLIGEAGYNNGIFKTEITLLSRRAGSYRVNDKLWISEISPSRLELKLLPLDKGLTQYPDLKERYSIFVNDGDFRDDTAIFLENFLEKITAIGIQESIVAKYGNAWFSRLISEYGITVFSTLMNDVESKFKEACRYEFANKYSDVGDGVNYGKVKTTAQPLSLSKKQIVDTCYKILVQVINSKLATPTVKELTTFDPGYDESLDPVTSALSRKTADTKFDTNSPVLKTIDLVKLGESSFSVGPTVGTQTGEGTSGTSGRSGTSGTSGGNATSGGSGRSSNTCYTYVNASPDIWIGDYFDCDGNYVSAARLGGYASICAVRGTTSTQSGTNLIESGLCNTPGGGGGGGGGGRGGRGGGIENPDGRGDIR